MTHWQHYYNAGIDYNQQGDWQKSAECHLKALELAPNLDFPEAWHTAGAALLRIDQAEQARPYLHTALRQYDAALAAGREAPAHCLFWKACAYSLLGQKTEMLATLRACLAEDDAYARKADYEEDLQPFAQDPDLRQLLDPVLEKIAAVTYRGESLSKADVSPAQLAWRAAFTQELAACGWVQDAFVEELWEGDMGVSPQAMYICPQNAAYGLRASLHLDTHLLFVELQNHTDPDDMIQFRLYYPPEQLPDQLLHSLRVVAQHQATLTTDTMTELLRQWLPTCASLQLQELDGARHTLSAM